MKNVHITVLLQTTIDMLEIQPGYTVVDGTLGAGGHTLEILDALEGRGRVFGIDLDSRAIKRSLERISSHPDGHLFTPMHGNFSHMESLLGAQGVSQVNAIVLDLGFSSNQLEEEGRGFSFQKDDEPLLMTLSDDDEAITAYDIVNHWGEEIIADILYTFGDEQFSRRIARAIVEARTNKVITSVGELREIIVSAVPRFYRQGRIHPATKSFQALRIAVNRELENLKEFLESLPRILAPGGRVSIISFHSLEDRMVKRAFQSMEEDGLGTRITKKPIIPDQEELSRNPRARSAKLRVFQIT